MAKDDMRDVLSYLRQRADASEDAERQKKLSALADKLETERAEPWIVKVIRGRVAKV